MAEKTGLVVLPENLFSSIVSYITSKPYNEVNGLMDDIKRSAIDGDAMVRGIIDGFMAGNEIETDDTFNKEEFVSHEINFETPDQERTQEGDIPVEPPEDAFISKEIDETLMV